MLYNSSVPKKISRGNDFCFVLRRKILDCLQYPQKSGTFEGCGLVDTETVYSQTPQKYINWKKDWFNFIILQCLKNKCYF